MDPEIKKFFELLIGYDNKSWSIDHAKKHNPGVHSYFLHDMEEMIKGMVGYPSILYLMNTIAFLGYCMKYEESWKVPKEANPKKNEFRDAGGQDDFVYFCTEYLSKLDERYKKLAEELFDFIRNRLSHVYSTQNIITTYPSGEHLEIKDKGSDYPYIFISVNNFFEDTKKGIETIYKELEEDQKKADQFFKKNRFILDYTWKLQRRLNNIELKNGSTNTSFFTNHYPTDGMGGTTGVTYTPPQL